MSQVFLSLKPEHITPPEGLTLVAVSWQLSAYTEFEYEYFIRGESLNDTTNINDISFLAEGILGNKAYYRYKRHYSDMSSSDWSQPIMIVIDETQPVVTNVMIETPKVSINVDYEQDISGEVVVKTNPINFYLGSGSHLSTDWDIEDDRKMDVISRLNDTALTELRLPASSFSDNRIYKVSVRHIARDGDMSGYGREVFNTMLRPNEMYTVPVKPTIIADKDIYFKVVPKTTQFKAVDLRLLDGEGNVLAAATTQETVTPTIKVSEEHLGKPYVLYIRIKLKNDTHTEYMPISAGTILGNYLIEVDTNVNYLGMMDYIQEINLRGITVQSGYELYDGSILLVKVNDNNIYRYAIENGILVEKGIVYTLPVEDNISLQYINFIPCYNGDVIVNYGANVASLTDQYTVFLKCSYNTVTKKLILKNRVSFDKEWLSTAVSNSAYVTTEGNLYYVPALEVGDDEKSIPLSMYTLDMTTLAKTKIDLPFVAYRHVSFAMVDKTKFIVFGGTGLQTIVNGEYMWERTNDRIYLFDTVTNTFTDVAGLPTDITKDTYNLQSFFRKDGKVVMFNGTRSGPSQGDQTSYVLDLTSYEMSYENTDILNDSVPYRSSVYLRSGDILRISAKTKDPQLVYNYISNTKTAEAIRTKVTTVVPTLFLTVNAGEVINVEDLGRYDKITILGDGLLRWQDGDIVREYNSNDLIITRDTTMTQEDFEAGQYARVIKLYAANLTIDNPNN